MKIVGLIAEYNPFHNGHQYHLEKTRELTGADAVAAVMSGDFVQRGAPALLPKQLRARMALSCGVSAVFELPVRYACGSAETFARGAVALLDSLGIPALSFGSECGDLAPLEQLADILTEEPKAYRTVLRDALRRGLSFPAARQEAVTAHTGDPALARILMSPNNTLAVEYLKAIRQLHSPIRPYTVKRIGSGHHSGELAQTCSSASAIRHRILLAEAAPSSISNEAGLSAPSDASGAPGKLAPSAGSALFDTLRPQLPTPCLDLLREQYQTRYPIWPDDLSLLLRYRLLNETPVTLCAYEDVTPELANRICNLRDQFLTWESFCTLLKTRELTYTRISRALLHILLGHKKKTATSTAVSANTTFSSTALCPYARLLGFRRRDTAVLHALKGSSAVPLITKLADAPDLGASGNQLLAEDLHAAALYESVLSDKYQLPLQNEYTQPLAII